MTPRYLLNMIQSFTTPEDHSIVHQCLEMSAELIRQGEEHRAARAARVAQIVEDFMCSEDIEVLIRFLPPAPATVTDTTRAEALLREANKQRWGDYALEAARCLLQTLILKAKGEEIAHIYPIFNFLEIKGIAIPMLLEKAPKMTAAQCIVKMARATPDHGKPCPRTEEMLGQAEYGVRVPVLITQASGILREWAYGEHPGRDALYLAILAARAVKGKGGEAKIEEAARYAHSKGIDVSGPLVEYILRREN